MCIVETINYETKIQTTISLNWMNSYIQYIEKIKILFWVLPIIKCKNKSDIL